MAEYQVKRTVLEVFYVDAKDRKEALYKVYMQGDPATCYIKSQTVKKLK